MVEQFYNMDIPAANPWTMRGLSAKLLLIFVEKLNKNYIKVSGDAYV
jgi:hypothetical protein